MFTYDYLLGLSQEVDLVWGKKIRMATVLYFMARYLPPFWPLYELLRRYVALPPSSVSFLTLIILPNADFCAVRFSLLSHPHCSLNPPLAVPFWCTLGKRWV